MSETRDLHRKKPIKIIANTFCLFVNFLRFVIEITPLNSQLLLTLFNNIKTRWEMQIQLYY